MLPLKKKIIEEYRRMLREYEKGKTYDYDYILDMINFLQVRKYLDNPHYIEVKFLSI